MILQLILLIQKPAKELAFVFENQELWLNFEEYLKISAKMSWLSI
jgi:hypothetical protein